MDLGLEDRVALVGGATRGIGRAIAEALVAEGARVVITARDPERTAAAAREIGALDGLAHDGGDAEAAPGLIAAVSERAGASPEILILNTGGPPMVPDPLAVTDAQWADAHRALVAGPLALLRAALPAMRTRGFGRVVAVGSTSLVEPIPALILSNAERSAQRAALVTIAHEVARDGVTINTLLTGSIATERIAAVHGSMEAAKQAAAERVPAGRLGAPAEMAAAAVFLCSEGAAYITGASLPVDGGMLHGV